MGADGYLGVDGYIYYTIPPPSRPRNLILQFITGGLEFLANTAWKWSLTSLAGADWPKVGEPGRESTTQKWRNQTLFCHIVNRIQLIPKYTVWKANVGWAGLLLLIGFKVRNTQYGRGCQILLSRRQLCTVCNIEPSELVKKRIINATVTTW